MADQMHDAEFDALAARLVDPATPAPGVSNVATGDAAAAAGRGEPGIHTGGGHENGQHPLA